MVQRLAVMAGKPQRSSSAPRLVKDLTCVLQVRTFYGNAERRQRRTSDVGGCCRRLARSQAAEPTHVPWTAVAG